jgi:hypothetical protein
MERSGQIFRQAGKIISSPRYRVRAESFSVFMGDGQDGGSHHCANIALSFATKPQRRCHELSLASEIASIF